MWVLKRREEWRGVLRPYRLQRQPRGEERRFAIERVWHVVVVSH